MFQTYLKAIKTNAKQMWVVLERRQTGQIIITQQDTGKLLMLLLLPTIEMIATHYVKQIFKSNNCKQIKN
jgi:hypothetical protein